MAFQTNRTPAAATSNYAKPATASASTSNVSKDGSIQLGGVYDGKPDSKLVLKGGKLKEAVTIPAGYTIKVFKKGGLSKNGKELPPYEIVAQAPRSV